MYYSSGVYELTEGATLVGGHAVKIIGWGTDSTSSTPYWLVANSWGYAKGWCVIIRASTTWGQTGLFMIRRGTDECSFEDELATGIPALS